MPASVQVNESCNKKLDPERLKGAMKTAMSLIAEDLTDTLTVEQPVGKTGKLHDSNTSSGDISGGHFTLKIKNSAEYWVYVNYGTSRQAANDFVGRTLAAVPVRDTLYEYFVKEYKRG